MKWLNLAIAVVLVTLTWEAAAINQLSEPVFVPGNQQTLLDYASGGTLELQLSASAYVTVTPISTLLQDVFLPAGYHALILYQDTAVGYQIAIASNPNATDASDASIKVLSGTLTTPVLKDSEQELVIPGKQVRAVVLDVNDRSVITELPQTPTLDNGRLSLALPANSGSAIYAFLCVEKTAATITAYGQERSFSVPPSASAGVVFAQYPERFQISFFNVNATDTAGINVKAERSDVTNHGVPEGYTALDGAFNVQIQAPNAASAQNIVVLLTYRYNPVRLEQLGIAQFESLRFYKYDGSQLREVPSSVDESVMTVRVAVPLQDDMIGTTEWAVAGESNPADSVHRRSWIALAISFVLAVSLLQIAL